MSGQIQVGAELLDYAGKTGQIAGEIMYAFTYIKECSDMMSDSKIYQGKAQEEISLYFSSLLLHMERLLTLYQAAAEYLFGVYQDFYYNEEQLSAWFQECVQSYYGEKEI